MREEEGFQWLPHPTSFQNLYFIQDPEIGSIELNSHIFYLISEFILPIPPTLAKDRSTSGEGVAICPWVVSRCSIRPVVCNLCSLEVIVLVMGRGHNSRKWDGRGVLLGCNLKVLTNILFWQQSISQVSSHLIGTWEVLEGSWHNDAVEQKDPTQFLHVTITSLESILCTLTSLWTFSCPEFDFFPSSFKSQQNHSPRVRNPKHAKWPKILSCRFNIILVFVKCPKPVVKEEAGGRFNQWGKAFRTVM